MTPPRVTLVADTFLPAHDDRTVTVSQVADRLVETGHEVQVVTSSAGLPSYHGSEVVRLPGVRPRGRQLRHALSAFGPDLVHVTSPQDLGRKALKQARRLGIPTVVVEQAVVPRFPPDYWRDQVAGRADRLLVTSTWIRDRLAQQHLPAELWLPGVDCHAFHPRLRDPHLHDHWLRDRRGQRDHRAPSPTGRETTDGVVVGYVGRLGKAEGVRELRALAGLPGVRLVVVGEGPQRAFLRSQLPHARFTGALTGLDLGVAMASMDVLVCPRRSESCGHTLRAAAASGVPVVAPGRAGAVDVVRPLESGLLYDGTDPDGLRQAVWALVLDRHRGLLGTAARELATGRDWAAATDELAVRHYGAVLGETGLRSVA